MTTETTTTTIDAGKRRKASAISGGLFLISLGILIWTGWWLADHDGPCGFP